MAAEPCVTGHHPRRIANTDIAGIAGMGIAGIAYNCHMLDHVQVQQDQQDQDLFALSKRRSICFQMVLVLCRLD